MTSPPTVTTTIAQTIGLEPTGIRNADGAVRGRLTEMTIAISWGAVRRLDAVGTLFGVGRKAVAAQPFDCIVVGAGLAGLASAPARHEEVELSWRILDPVTARWASPQAERPEQYAAGTWGPAASDAMMAADGRSWRLP